jgi:hypothetical protein
MEPHRARINTLIKVRIILSINRKFMMLDLQQIDLKLQNMMQFMNDFAVNFQSNLSQSASSFRPSSGTGGGSSNY